MNLKLTTNAPEGLKNELCDIIRAFEPYIFLSEDSNNYVEVNFNDSCIEISSNFCENKFDFANENSTYLSTGEKRNIKRRAKRKLYFYLSKYLQVTLPYGSLTGIRPTKIFYELAEEKKNPYEVMVNYFGVSQKKAKLVSEVVNTQKRIYNQDNDRYDTFVNIPFCPTRCSYCSFISDVVDRVKGKLELYVNALCRDINEEQNIMPNGKRRAIYIGGGTPTSIPLVQLEKILKAINANGEEFTVEAGRPDTISKEILELLASYNVTRISVNPQTFKDETLAVIGRKGSAKAVIQAYEMAREYIFDINMDLISSLPTESFDDFKKSVDTAISLAPDNITIHSLSIKRGSNLHLVGYDTDNWEQAYKMNDYATDALLSAGYHPYYMYRQKNTIGRLENVGYAKKGKVCIYNVDIMEETHSVYASGAGAISKTVDGNRIERLAEAKDIYLYPDRVDEYIEKKKLFFNNL